MPNALVQDIKESLPGGLVFQAEKTWQLIQRPARSLTAQDEILFWQTVMLAFTNGKVTAAIQARRDVDKAIADARRRS